MWLSAILPLHWHQAGSIIHLRSSGATRKPTIVLFVRVLVKQLTKDKGRA
jgi:hypothetical protein